MDILGRILLSVSIISLLHAGFSTIQYKTYLKLIEEDFQHIPIDVSNKILSSYKEKQLKRHYFQQKNCLYLIQFWKL